MGFFSNAFSKVGNLARNIGSGIQSGIKKVGTFIQEGGIGKISGIASSIGEAINSPIGQGVLGALSFVPGIGSLANVISKAGKPLESLGRFGSSADALGRNVASAVQNRDPSQLGEIINQGADLFEAGKGLRAGFGK